MTRRYRYGMKCPKCGSEMVHTCSGEPCDQSGDCEQCNQEDTWLCLIDRHEEKVGGEKSVH